MLSVVLVIILALLGLVMIRMGSSARVLAIRTTSDISARAAADAGMTQAVRLMNIKLVTEPHWDNSTLPSATDVELPNSYATYSFKVEGEPKGGFTVTSVGKCVSAERTVHSTLKTESLWFGIGVKLDVDILVKTTFGTLPADSSFTIRTNSVQDNAIRLFAGTYIPGDVIVGPGGDVDTVVNTKSTTTVDGDVYAAEEEIEFPPVVVPDLPYKGALPPPVPGDPNLITLTAADSGIYDSIKIGQGQKLHIVDGDVTIYVKDDMRLHQGAELRIYDNASLPSLNIYLGGELQSDQGSLMITDNYIDSGTRLKIFGTDTCESIVLMNSGDLSAAIYAPYAGLELKNSGDFYGSLVGNSLEMKNSGRFIFDTRLLDINIEDEAAYLVQRWWEE